MKPTDIGPNRTGIKASPLHAKQAIAGAEKGVPNPSTDLTAAERVCASYAKGAAPLGTMPPPASIKGAAKTTVEAVKGHDAAVFLDLIGERLAFERTGTRLYQGLLARWDAASLHEGDPSRAELEEICDQELAHFHLLRRAMEQLGGDPTAITPAADAMAVASMGLGQAIGDPRTTFTQGLKAILVAELADNDGWSCLAEVAEKIGKGDLAEDFRRALAEEEVHLTKVRGWITNAVQGQVGIAKRAALPREEQPSP